MKNLMIGLFVFVSLVGLAGATDYFCAEPAYNMDSFSPLTINLRGPIMLSSEHILLSDCCESPSYNNHNIPSKISFNVINLDNQHIVFDDCCDAPIYNNHQIKENFSPKVIYLDTFNLEEPCCTL